MLQDSSHHCKKPEKDHSTKPRHKSPARLSRKQSQSGFAEMQDSEHSRRIEQDRTEPTSPNKKSSRDDEAPCPVTPKRTERETLFTSALSHSFTCRSPEHHQSSANLSIASQSTPLGRSITPFRRRSCMGSSPSTPLRSIRRRASLAGTETGSVTSKSVASAPVLSVPTLPSLDTTSTARPTLSRGSSQNDSLYASRRSLQRRLSRTNLLGSFEQEEEDQAVSKISDPSSTVAAMSSTPLPRTKKLSRRDLLRKSRSSNALAAPSL